ncbi:hypothetical protein B7C62_27745 [Kitasatospora albolonga]|uniref:Uncharacterized protein n=1 Tax=Kitasatospora albolonga TaxID=68173 RepID=A0ABC8C020_9ACTN|nr:hypothetical protein B7C62_27745 [Kitasatospora albolonga]
MPAPPSPPPDHPCSVQVTAIHPIGRALGVNTGGAGGAFAVRATACDHRRPTVGPWAVGTGRRW